MDWFLYDRELRQERVKYKTEKKTETLKQNLQNGATVNGPQGMYQTSTNSVFLLTLRSGGELEKISKICKCDPYVY